MFNNYDKGKHALIYLNRDDLFACVDKIDLELLDNYKWYAIIPSGLNKSFYAISSTEIYMHRLVLGTSSILHTDHKNGNGLDNRRSNLRECTPSQNQGNSIINKNSCSSLYRGVRWHKRDKRWLAIIARNEIGRFHDEIDAAIAYDLAAMDRWGEFAKLNFPRLAGCI